MRFALCRTTFSLATGSLFLLSAQLLNAQSAPAPTPRQSDSKPASALIQKQDPPKVAARLMEQITPDTARLLVALSKQRIYLMLNEESAIDAPISSGKRSGMTPAGNFTITEKDLDHASNIYGDFVDDRGRVVRAGVSLKIDSAPSGTKYRGTPMRFFMRLTDTGVGIHVGLLPGYPASHGCIRISEDVARLIYEKIKVGTPVEIVP